MPRSPGELPGATVPPPNASTLASITPPDPLSVPLAPSRTVSALTTPPCSTVRVPVPPLVTSSDSRPIPMNRPPSYSEPVPDTSTWPVEPTLRPMKFTASVFCNTLPPAVMFSLPSPPSLRPILTNPRRGPVTSIVDPGPVTLIVPKASRPAWKPGDAGSSAPSMSTRPPLVISSVPVPLLPIVTKASTPLTLSSDPAPSMLMSPVPPERPAFTKGLNGPILTLPPSCMFKIPRLFRPSPTVKLPEPIFHAEPWPETVTVPVTFSERGPPGPNVLRAFAINPVPVFRMAPSSISNVTFVGASGVGDNPFSPTPTDRGWLLRKLTLVPAPVIVMLAVLPAFWPKSLGFTFVAFTVAPPETDRLDCP